MWYMQINLPCLTSTTPKQKKNLWSGHPSPPSALEWQWAACFHDRASLSFYASEFWALSSVAHVTQRSAWGKTTFLDRMHGASLHLSTRICVMATALPVDWWRRKEECNTAYEARDLKKCPLSSRNHFFFQNNIYHTWQSWHLQCLGLNSSNTGKNNIANVTHLHADHTDQVAAVKPLR